MASLPILPQSAPQSLPRFESDPEHRILPDYLPARMVNEFSYCPRLFFYEWVEGVFAESADTVEGSAQHKRVDKEGPGLPEPGELSEDLRTRSVTMSSEEHSLIARMDLVDVTDGVLRVFDNVPYSVH